MAPKKSGRPRDDLLTGGANADQLLDLAGRDTLQLNGAFDAEGTVDLDVHHYRVLHYLRAAARSCL